MTKQETEEDICMNCARQIPKKQRDRNYCSVECRIAVRREESTRIVAPRLRPIAYWNT